jgi:hypothetical protein
LIRISFIIIFLVLLSSLPIRGLPDLELPLVPLLVSTGHLAVFEFLLLAHVRPSNTDALHDLGGGPLRIALLQDLSMLLTEVDIRRERLLGVIPSRLLTGGRLLQPSIWRGVLRDST